MRHISVCSSALALVLSCTMSNPSPLDRSTSESPVAAPITAESHSGARSVHFDETTFRMGAADRDPDQRPVHAVHLRAFDIDLSEVTVRDYEECVSAGACRPLPTVVEEEGAMAEETVSLECNGGLTDRLDQPVGCVDWSMAARYCEWSGGRLPTEEEWEFGACGGSCSEPHASGARVDSILSQEGPSYVWEWTSSAYCPYPHRACGDARRVVRGGSSVELFRDRLTARSPMAISTRSPYLGFRCARSAS